MATLILPITLIFFKNILHRTGNGKRLFQFFEYFDINSVKVHMRRTRSVCTPVISIARKIPIPPGSSLSYQKTKKYHFSNLFVKNC